MTPIRFSVPFDDRCRVRTIRKTSKPTSSTRNGRPNTIASHSLLGPLPWSRCEKSANAPIVSAAQIYYGTRGREIGRFEVRGPHAKAAIDAVWSTPDDRQIDDFVRHALQYGILHKRDFPGNSYPEFVRFFADVQELGAGCSTTDSR